MTLKKILSLLPWISTFCVILLGFLAPQQLDVWGNMIAILVIVLLGIPHGATDHLLFKSLAKNSGRFSWISFLAKYLFLITIFLLLWWKIPVLAMAVFLLISAYHFGQSQWIKLNASTTVGAVWYMLWGGYILMAVLLLNYEETYPILKSIIGYAPMISRFWQLFLPLIYLVLICLLIRELYVSQVISKARAIREVFVLILLILNFLQAPLLTGFAVFFVFWHSLESFQQQIIGLNVLHDQSSIRQYLAHLIFFSLIAISIIAAFSLSDTARLLSYQWIGHIFIFISVITIPHSLLMDSFLKNTANPYKA